MARHLQHALTISTIICASSELRLHSLLATVRSVQVQSRPAHEIIVVIDHNPGLQAALGAQLSGVTLVANQAAKGLSGARNTGVRTATGQIVAFIDDDAIASRDWLKSLASAYTSQFTLGAGGPIVPHWPDMRPDWFPAEFDWTVGCSYAGEATSPSAVQNLIGCNMSFRRNAVLMAGLFDEHLGRNGNNGAGGEESDLARRMLAMFPTSHLAHVPGASVRHFIAPERTNFAYFVKRCRAEGRSKALMTKDISRERSFVLSRLGSAFFANLGATLTFKDTHGWKKSLAIFTGLTSAAGTYLWARQTGVKPLDRHVPFHPLKVADIEFKALHEAPSRQILPGESDDHHSFGSAMCVVRNDGHLQAVREVPLYGAPLNAAALEQLLDLPTPEVTQATARSTLSARVVIATRDRPDMLDKCLTSILAQDYPDFEVVVVDSASESPETRQLLARKYAGHPALRCVREDRPGLARAHNRGVEGLARDIVAFTDDDVIADPRWLTTLAQAFDAHPQAGAVTGAILPAELDTRAQYWTERHGAFLKGTDQRLFDLDERRPASPLFPYAAGTMGSGANMAFRREALELIGPFDTALGAGTAARGGDDLDAFLAIIQAGFQLAYQPDAIVWHHHRRSEDGMQRQAYGYGVGLGAYLTKVVLTQPGAALHFLKALPAAYGHLFGSNAEKLTRLPSDYPRDLIWRERFGILGGIPAYFKSRHQNRQDPKRPALAAIHLPVWKGN